MKIGVIFNLTLSLVNSLLYCYAGETPAEKEVVLALFPTKTLMVTEDEKRDAAGRGHVSVCYRGLWRTRYESYVVSVGQRKDLLPYKCMSLYYLFQEDIIGMSLLS